MGPLDDSYTSWARNGWDGQNVQIVDINATIHIVYIYIYIFYVYTTYIHLYTLTKFRYTMMVRKHV